MRAVRVLIADDHAMFAEALEAIIEVDGRLTVVGRASNGEEAIDYAERLQPDIVLLDISMPVLNGFEAAEKMSALPEPPMILMLSGSNSNADMEKARKVGARGYVTKDAIAARLIEAIIEAAAVDAQNGTHSLQQP